MIALQETDTRSADFCTYIKKHIQDEKKRAEEAGEKLEIYVPYEVGIGWIEVDDVQSISPDALLVVGQLNNGQSCYDAQVVVGDPRHLRFYFIRSSQDNTGGKATIIG
jgi:hypothetical protein